MARRIWEKIDHDAASGEYWCGVLTVFPDGTGGGQVRIEQSDHEEDEFIAVPDRPMPTQKVRV